MELRGRIRFRKKRLTVTKQSRPCKRLMMMLKMMSVKIKMMRLHGYGRGFLASIDVLDDPLLRSVFRQGTVVKVWKHLNWDVEFSTKLMFFKDLLDDAADIWMPLLSGHFSPSRNFTPVFTCSAVYVVKPVDLIVPEHLPVSEPPHMLTQKTYYAPRHVTGERDD